MAGTLQFTLGLETSNFLRGMGIASGQIVSFIAASKSLHQIIEGTWAAIERGAALEHLSKRTGESVGNLFLLQKAMKAVGLDSGNVGTILFQLNKALGGTNEMGEPTKHIFDQLGLSIDALKGKSAPEALQDIFAALNNLNNASATYAASQIFGRGGAQDALQAARSAKEFSEAIGGNQTGADAAERTAHSFAKIAIQIDALKNKSKAIFNGIAESVAPLIENMLKFTKSVDFTAIGLQIGKVIRAVINAFSDGRLIELIGLSISTGFQVGLATLPALFEKLGVLLLKIFETPLTYFQAGLDYVIQNLFASLPQFLQEMLGVEGSKKITFAEALKQRKESGVEFFSQGNNISAINDDANQRIKDAMAKAKEIGGPLAELVNNLAGELAATKAEVGGQGNLDITKERKVKGDRPDNLTSLEKIGFVFNSRGSLNDPSRETATNTRLMHQELKRTNQLLSNDRGFNALVHE